MVPRGSFALEKKGGGPKGKDGRRRRREGGEKV